MGGVNHQPKRRGRPPKVRPEVMVSAFNEAISQAGEQAAINDREAARTGVLSAGVWYSGARPEDGTCEAKDCSNDATEKDMTTGIETCPVHHDLSPAQVTALDRDHDGNPGGSYPRASLTDQEMTGFLAEFREAYEAQEERKRIDGFNRVWTFGFVIIKNQHTMRIHAKRGPVESERLLNSAWMPSDDVEAAILVVSEETGR